MINEPKSDILGSEYVTSNLSFSERFLFNEIWAERLSRKTPHNSKEYSNQLLDVRDRYFSMGESTTERLNALGKEMASKQKDRASLTEALFEDKFGGVSSTALLTILLEMTDFEEFSKARIGVLPESVFLKMEKRYGRHTFNSIINPLKKRLGINLSSECYENFYLGEHPADSEYFSQYAKQPLVKPKENLIAYALNNKGRSLQDQKKFKEAIRCYDKALEIEPRFSHFFYNKGNALAFMRKYEKAIECYDRALKLDKKHVLALNNKGAIYMHLGDYEKANKCFDKALKLDPKLTLTISNKVQVLNLMHRSDEALKYEKLYHWNQ